MDLSDIIKNVNSYIGDTSEDRVTNEDRYQALTEATAWLLEELGNEHMTDRTEIEYLPTVTWYKVDNLTPYLLTSGQLRFTNEEQNNGDFTRVEPRQLVQLNENKHAYAIERYNGSSYLGIIVPQSQFKVSTDLVPFTQEDSLTYTGINATNIVGEGNAVRFDMAATGEAVSGLSTTTDEINLESYENKGTLIVEVELTDITDVNSISIKFGDDLSTDYWLGTVNQDINGNALVEGVNTIKVRWSDLTKVGTPDITTITEWSVTINHETSKPVATEFKISDLRIAIPLFLNFKYVFYRVGKDTSGDDIIEFSATTDEPFFAGRYPQYRYAVAHKAAAALYREMTLYQNAATEDGLAFQSLKRFRKNFSGERDTGSSAFRPAGITFRGRTIRRRY